jgi:hypothetical protein
VSAKGNMASKDPLTFFFLFFSVFSTCSAGRKGPKFRGADDRD